MIDLDLYIQELKSHTYGNIHYHDCSELIRDRSKNDVVILGGTFNMGIIQDHLRRKNKIIIILKDQIEYSKEDFEILRDSNISVIFSNLEYNSNITEGLHFDLVDMKKDPEQVMIHPHLEDIEYNCILLRRDQKRIKHVQDNVEPILGIVRRQDAVDAMTPHAIDDAVRLNQLPIMKPIRAGKIGNMFSHIAVWKHLLNDLSGDYSGVLVLEDDSYPVQNFHKLFRKTLLDLSPTYDVLYLYVNDFLKEEIENKCQNSSEYDNNSMLCRNIESEYTSAYLISRKGASRLLKNITSIREPLGMTMVKLARRGKLETYISRYSLFDNIGQKTCNQEIFDGILKSNVCNSEFYVPDDR